MKGATSGKIWDNLNLKINKKQMEDSPLNKIGICKSTLTIERL